MVIIIIAKKFGTKLYGYNYKIVKNDGSECKFYISFDITMHSENKPVYFAFNVVDKYGACFYGIAGGSVEPGYRKYQQLNWLGTDDYFGFYEGEIYELPTATKLDETFYEFEVDVYQGESIEVENFGTLWYVGLKNYDGQIVYKYMNSLDELNPVSGKNYTFKLKNQNDYEYTRELVNWTLSEEAYEPESKETRYGYVGTALKGDISVVINGKTTFDKANAVEISKLDALYAKLINGLEKNFSKNKYDSTEILAFDIYCKGNYEGKLTVTFNVGSAHNGKKYVVGHLKGGLEYEYFEGTVENGKITIEVDSLSPFMVSLVAEKSNNNTNEETNNNKTDTDKKNDTDKKPTTNTKGELDETPKTGSKNLVSNVIVSSLVTVLVSLIGVVVCKKKE